MTTTTTIKAVPTFSTDQTTLKNVIANPTWSATNSNFSAGGTAGATKWVEKVTVSLVGQADSSKTPAKEITAWLSENASAISSASLTTETKVSSWAVVVDVTTKTSSATSYNQAIIKDTAATPNCVNTVTATGTTTGYPAVGAPGDTWAIILTTGVSSNKQPFAIRAGNYVSTVTAAN